LFRPLYSTSLCVAAKWLLQTTVRATSHTVTRMDITHKVSQKCQDTAHRSATMVKQASRCAKQKVVSSFQKDRRNNYQRVLVKKTKYTCRMLQRKMKRACFQAVKSLKHKQIRRNNTNSFPHPQRSLVPGARSFKRFLLSTTFQQCPKKTNKQRA
jgi:hypothetical protein